MQVKDFDTWNEQKKALDSSDRETLIFREREIWWCSLGLNIGDEQDGKNDFYERPVLVIKKFNNRVAWVLPMSTTNKVGIYFHEIMFEERTSTLSLSQIRLVSVKRFRRFIGKIPYEELCVIRQKMIDLFK